VVLSKYGVVVVVGHGVVVVVPEEDKD